MAEATEKTDRKSDPQGRNEAVVSVPRLGKDLVDDMPLSHEGCKAFWDYWEEYGETHKHGFYESTWGAIRAYLKKAAETTDQKAH